jgi:hypothetical protein
LTAADETLKIPDVKTVTYEDLRWQMTRIAGEVISGKRYVATFHGKPKFALVPVADLEQIEGKPLAVKPTKRRPK